jgi:hypothetical protein
MGEFPGMWPELPAVAVATEPPPDARKAATDRSGRGHRRCRSGAVNHVYGGLIVNRIRRHWYPVGQSSTSAMEFSALAITLCPKPLDSCLSRRERGRR